MIIALSAWDFRRIAALRTVFLIPHSRLKLAGGMLLAQLIVAAVGTGLVLLIGHAEPPAGHGEPLALLAWGSPRGTFEILFGCLLLVVVLLQIITGPSRVVSFVTSAVIAVLSWRIKWFTQPEILGMPTADVLALAGSLAWLLFTGWYVSAWRPAAPRAVAGNPLASGPAVRAGRKSAAASVAVSRQAAIQAFLLGQPSLLRVCRQQLAPWMAYHLVIIAAMAGMKLLVARYDFPPNYTAAITVLLYAPFVGVNTIAGCLARGSRRLWLCSGESRDVLYAIAARLAWRSLVLLEIPLFGLALLEIRLLPHGDIDLLLPLAISVTVTPAALYLGLLNFQRRLNPWLLPLSLIACGAIVAGSFVESSQGKQILWIAPCALVLIACMLRAIARRRWHGIDWLRFRAERANSPFAVQRVRV
jgi:hypothetical protein